MARSCGLCGFQAGDDNSFRDHMISVHKWGVAPPRQREIRVKEYKDGKQFQGDAQKMLRDGWTIDQQSQGSTHTNVGRTLLTTALTGGLNLLTPKIGGASFTKGKITVTWLRGGDMPAKATKKCPDCAEEVLAEARVCKHCAHRFGA